MKVSQHFALSLLLICTILFDLATSVTHHQIYDLSHPITQDMPIWDYAAPPEISLEKQDEGHGLRAEHYDICISEKVGTHINAPSTYKKGHHNNSVYSVDHIPLDYLVNIPAVVIDPRAVMGVSHAIIRSLQLNMTHLNLWERQHGKIPHGAFVILRSGWDEYYGKRDKFFGLFDDEENQVFPEFGYEATKWLIEQRSIVGIGTECPDIELTQKGEVKLLLSTRGHFSIMQLTNVDQLPMRGFSVTMAPLKLQGGSGGPTRVFAFIDPHKKRHRDRLHQKQNELHLKRDELCRDYAKIQGEPQAYSSAISSSINYSPKILLILVMLHRYCF